MPQYRAQPSAHKTESGRPTAAHHERTRRTRNPPKPSPPPRLHSTRSRHLRPPLAGDEGEEAVAAPQGGQVLLHLLRLPRAPQGARLRPFVHHLLVHGLLPADDALRELLSAARPPPLFTSKCVQAELRRLGKSHSQAFDAAQLLATASCEHDKVVSAVDCILSLVGDKNPEHYFVATQDSGLQAKLREVPCVPVIYGLKNSLFIEQPSVQQRKFAQLDEEKRIHMEKSEFKKLLKASSEGKTSVDGNIPGVVAEKSKFKRNRAKGPNPLSCKKKKPKPQPSAAQNQGPKTDGEAKHKRVRKRKRSGKDSNQAEITR
ncbi:rRNA-processing protein UTP23 [Hordeum vulgare]|nr:rRNA-processing protein UTP23 [Hordeum vulgare]